MKIVVIFPTATEAQFFVRENVIVEIGGVGLSAAAYSTTKIIARHRPDWLIMAGIAGVYPSSPHKVGDVVMVASECEADLGFFSPQGFIHLADLPLAMDFERAKHWHSPHRLVAPGFPWVNSNSMNAAMAPFVNIQGVDIENMEGAAFFRVCLAEHQPFLQLRSISNEVNQPEDAWDMEGSIRQLTAGLERLLDGLLADH